MKTAEITLETIKDSDGWVSLGFELGMDYDRISKVFEYGEFGSIRIVVDENLKIIDGEIIPFIK